MARFIQLQIGTSEITSEYDDVLGYHVQRRRIIYRPTYVNLDRVETVSLRDDGAVLLKLFGNEETLRIDYSFEQLADILNI